MTSNNGNHTIIRLRANSSTIYASQGNIAFIAEENGFIEDGRVQGLFVHETRMLSRLRYLIDGQAPLHITSSNVQQHAYPAGRLSPRSPQRGQVRVCGALRSTS